MFAGIGAQRMALTLAGIPYEVVAISEIDRHALASYEAIWGDCPNLGDITKIERLPPCDLVTYSFPCVDLSLAGKRAGMAEGSGTRSGLVWEVTRLLEGAEERPEWLLMENVPQVLTAPEWPSLLRRLADMGYRNKWVKADSSKFGSAQKRVRAFMVSRLNADPPDLPESAPNAPMLCLRDVMEAERDERYIRRIPLDRIKWRQPKEGYRHPQSAGLDCPLMDASDPRMETRRIASEDSLCPAIRRGALQKTVEEEEEERVRPLVAVADNLRNAPKGRKAVGTVTADGERLKVAPSDRSGESTPCASIEGETFYSKAMLYSPASQCPTVRKQGRHGTSNQIKVIDGTGKSTPIAEDESESFYSRRMLYSSSSSSPTLRRLHSIRDMVKVIGGPDGGSAVSEDLQVLGLDRSEGSWKPHNYILGGDGKSRCVGSYVNAAQRGIKVAADWDRPERPDVANRLYEEESQSPTLFAHTGGGRDVFVAETPGDGGLLTVNVLTPRECWRLMGFPEWAFIRASRVSSETQLYN